RLLTQLPGKPTVLVSEHPVKNAAEDNLLPYGGGAIFNEIDGNLTLWFDDGHVKLDWNKVRGPHFRPRFFVTQLCPSPDVVDDEGAMIMLPVMRPRDEQEISSAPKADQTVALLRAMLANAGGTQR